MKGLFHIRFLWDTLPRGDTAAFVVGLSLLTAECNYLLFHTAAEGFAIVVAALIYVLATWTYKCSQNEMLLFLGKAYASVAALDFLHLATYHGMGLFPGYGADTATQLWIAGRCLVGAALFVSPLLLKRRISQVAWTLICIVTTASLIWSIMCVRAFPTCFVEGEGLTQFKIWSEYLVMTLVAGGMFRLHARRADLDQHLYAALMCSMGATILSELCFVLHTDVYGLANLVGHLIKVLSYYCIYRGVVRHRLIAPYDSIFAELRTQAIHDSLTGLYNRNGFMLSAERDIAAAREDREQVGILMADLDKFKRVNDLHGHLAGDEVLKQFAGLLRTAVGTSGTPARLGGDEFVAILRDVSREDLDFAAARVRRAVHEWAQASEIAHDLDVNVGTFLWQPGSPGDIDTLIRKADEAMYQEKEVKKNRSEVVRQ
ncbi:MAG: GGDEF domain-containing protein [Firmicutes bacterium]|nr:GGDEF domain-containing protein [Bacillota bacterium]